MKKRPGEDRGKVKDLNSYRKNINKNSINKKKNQGMTNDRVRRLEEEGRTKTGRYSYGSSDSDRGEVPRGKKRVQKAPKKTERKFKRPTYNSVMHKVTWVVGFLGILLGVLIIGFMYRYSEISSLKYEINGLNKELEELKNNKKELQLEIEKSKRSDMIEKIAQEQLGMQYPTDDQIIYINVD